MVCSVCFLFAALLILIFWKIYLKLRVKYNGCYACLVGKTVIVTGGNSGIGYVAALDFAKRGAKVILACRNKERAEDAVWRIRKETGNENVSYKHLDLVSLDSVRAFAKEITENEERLDILVNNAGGIGFDNKLMENGVQMAIQINHVGPFLLTHLLVDKLKKSIPSRIVNVASMAGYLAGDVDVEDLNKPRKDSIFVAQTLYNYSKWCNILFTLELARKLDGTGVTANTLHPGSINNEFLNNYPILQTFIKFIASLFFKTSLEGAQTTIYVALSKDLEGINGKLFDNCKEIELYRNCKDPEKARKLWKMSEEWAKIKTNEIIK